LNANAKLYAQWNNQVVSDCDGQSFKKVKIGDQTWMAENLNCNVSGSKCYNNNEYYCNIYGRLYDWATAMGIDAKYNRQLWGGSDVRHKGVCPTGWHLPSNAEWTTLTDFVGSNEGTQLKATTGWNSCGPSGSGKSYLCEDTFGFSALPGGRGYSDGYFNTVGNYGGWWSASEYNSRNAYGRDMYYYNEYAYWSYDSKDYLFSVRCVQD